MYCDRGMLEMTASVVVKYIVVNPRKTVLIWEINDEIHRKVVTMTEIMGSWKM